jgi:hypothetical protein
MTAWTMLSGSIIFIPKTSPLCFVGMEQYNLYAQHYNGVTNNYEGIESGEKFLSVYKGIYQHRATRGSSIYPVLKYLGCVNITTRTFFKGSKHPRKIIIQEGNRVILFDHHNRPAEHTYTLLPTLFTELGYPESLLNEITNVVITASNDPKIRSRDYNRVGGEADGIVNF